MMQRPLVRTALSPLTALLLLLAAAPAAPAERVALNVPDLPRLAEAGRFDDVLAVLKANPPLADDPQVVHLMADLEAHRAHEAERATERRKAFDEAVAKIAEQLEEGQIEEALASAIEAHNIADDPAAFLTDEKTEQLILRTEQMAAEANDDERWLDALSLYRTLEMLFQERGRYSDTIQDTERRLRLLRFYAPEELQRLYAERARRRGEEDAEPIRLGSESWPQRLSRIRERMMQQAVRQAAKAHVTNPGHEPLLESGIDALLLMTRTLGLGQTFPGLADADRVSAFRRGLGALRQEVGTKGDRLDVLMALLEISQLNDDTVQLPEQVLAFEFTDGALSILDDFTSVIWPRDKEHFARNTQGKFYGVGIQISSRDGRLIVVSPLENTPAQRAGIKAQDIIAQVDGVDTSDWTLDRAVREITGPEGTEVVLGIERAGEADLLTFPIKRAEIPIESIRGWQHRPAGVGGWDFFIDRPHRIGYVRISQFIPQTADDLDAAINQMESELPDGERLRGLIIDLRFNPGGLLSAAIEVSDRFVREGTIVATVDGRQQETFSRGARAERTYRPFPTIVLVNEGSASASEIVSGVIQDYGRGLIVGERTFGKGSVQDLYPISRGLAYLKLTTQYYRLPKGRIIHRKPGAATWGIEPNLTVKMTARQIADAIEMRQKVDILRDEPPADADAEPAPTAAEILARGVDPQLEAALLVLKTRLVADHIQLARGGAAPTP